MILTDDFVFLHPPKTGGFAECAKGRRTPEFASFDWDRIEKEFPAFPQLSFADFLAVFGRVGYRLDTPDGPGLGWGTVRYANQFVPAPAPDVTSPDAMIVDAVVERTRDVRFIHTENLNRELYDALGEVGVPQQRRAFILDAAKVLPTKGGRRADQQWRGYYTDETMAFVRQIDAALFTRFPEYLQL